MKKAQIFIPLYGDNNYIKIVSIEDVNQDYFNTLIDSEYTQYLASNFEAKFSIQDLQENVERLYLSTEDYLFGLYKDGYLIGTSRVHDIHNDEAWQGALIFKHFQKQGNGQILIKNVSDYVLGCFNISKIKAGIAQENIGSQKIFRKCGFSYLINHSKQEWQQIWVKTHV